VFGVVGLLIGDIILFIKGFDSGSNKYVADDCVPCELGIYKNGSILSEFGLGKSDRGKLELPLLSKVSPVNGVKIWGWLTIEIFVFFVGSRQ
ncbi:4980_t:CDS:2, partial [Gigaspora rosea]